MREDVVFKGSKIGLQLFLNEDIKKMEEGTDLTDILEVQKYEPPIPAQLAGQVRGSFPSYIRKTDQERIRLQCKFYD